jgi:hypothetical protein
VLGDLPVGLPVGDELEDLAFLRGQPLQLRWYAFAGAGAFDDAADQRRVEQ